MTTATADAALFATLMHRLQFSILIKHKLNNSIQTEVSIIRRGGEAGWDNHVITMDGF